MFALYALLGVLGYFAYASYSDSEKAKAAEKAANDLKRGWKPMLATDPMTDYKALDAYAQAGMVSPFFGLKNDTGPNPVIMTATGKVLKTEVDHGPGTGPTGTRFWTIEIVPSSKEFAGSIFGKQYTALPTGTIETPAPLPPPAYGAIFMVRDGDFPK